MQNFCGLQLFWEGRPRLFYGRFTIHRLVKFSGLPFANLCLRSLAMKYRMQNLRTLGLVKKSVPILSRL